MCNARLGPLWRLPMPPHCPPDCCASRRNPPSSASPNTTFVASSPTFAKTIKALPPARKPRVRQGKCPGWSGKEGTQSWPRTNAILSYRPGRLTTRNKLNPREIRVSSRCFFVSISPLLAGLHFLHLPATYFFRRELSFCIHRAAREPHEGGRCLGGSFPPVCAKWCLTPPIRLGFNRTPNGPTYPHWKQSPRHGKAGSQPIVCF